MLAAEEIARRLREVRERIVDAARRSSRSPDGIRLVLASKTQPPEAIRAAYDAGARDFGENYVQEALGKQEALRDLSDLRWHLIGHLQTNKARIAASSFALIHSVDSTRLAHALARSQSDQRVRVLIEVNLGGEETKSGVAADHIAEIVEGARAGLDIAGLMIIPPPGDDPESARSYFTELRALRDRLAVRTGLALSELSMGMTDDFEIAIEEGATIVRVGRAVFGERTR
jgi:pyridoxal phosphate enzyme (YggS family)